MTDELTGYEEDIDVFREVRGCEPLLGREKETDCAMLALQEAVRKAESDFDQAVKQ